MDCSEEPFKPNATYFLWGGPPGPQAHPLVGFLGPRSMVGQGAGRGSGDPPHRAGSVRWWKSKWHWPFKPAALGIPGQVEPGFLRGVGAGVELNACQFP